MVLLSQFSFDNIFLKWLQLKHLFRHVDVNCDSEFDSLEKRFWLSVSTNFYIYYQLSYSILLITMSGIASDGSKFAEAYGATENE